MSHATGSSDATRWNRVRAIFEQALDLPASERAAHVEQECAGNTALRDGVQALLAGHQEDEFLVAPDAARQHARLGAPPAELAVGTRFAGFEVLGLLGAGGMGCVYEALQSEPRRRVALKLLRPGRGGSSAVARFRWEAEVLGRLRHPAIAQVFASGVEPDGEGGGMPWFALELVAEARPLTDAVREDGLDRRAVLALFTEVCDAVQHGHHHGVVHRDLKPANLLIDGDGRVKVIDFGVARSLLGDDDSTRLTRAGDVIGTLGAMAPEQLDGDPEAVDARADVYALGAVLHELLTGEPLFDLADCSLTEAALRLRVETPRRPSVVRPGVPEELDWIVVRATERDPQRRYGSASELAADVRRFLAREPVLAGPPTATYRLRTFVRRHRWGVGAAAAVLLSLVAGLIGTTTWMVRAERSAERAEKAQRDAEVAAAVADEQRGLAVANAERAEQQRGLADAERLRAEQGAALARATAEFVEGLIRSPDPALDGDEVRVVDVLARADEQLALSLAEHPHMAATLQGTLGRLHYNLGLHEAARRHLAAAVALSGGGAGGAPRASGDHAATTADARANERLRWRASLAETLRELGDLAGAEDEMTTVLSDRLQRLGEDHADTGRSLAALALLRQAQGRLGEAEELYGRALPILVRHLGEDHEHVLNARVNLGTLLLTGRDHGSARSVLEDVVPRLREHLGRRHPLTIMALSNLASTAIFQGELAEGAEWLAEAMSLRREVLPPDHPALLGDLANLSVLRLRLGEPEEAARLCSEVIAAREASDPRAPDVVLMRCNRLFMRQGAGDMTAVEREIHELLDMDLASTAEDPAALAYLENVSRDLAVWGLHDLALAFVDTGLRGRERMAPDDAEGHFAAWRARALVQAVGGHDAGPELEALVRWRSRLHDTRRDVLTEELGQALELQGREDLASAWREAHQDG